MMFSWLRQRRRRQLLAEPFPAEWDAILASHVRDYRWLAEDERRRLQDDARIFVAEKHWEGCAGLELTDEMRVAVAGWACLLVLNRPHDYFGHVKSILLYPESYVGPDMTREGLVHEDIELLGQAHYRGPVILSWRDVAAASRPRSRRQNVVLHEFAHQLDMQDRSVDGTPPLDSREDYQAWVEVMNREYDRLTDDWAAGRPTVLDPYGASDEAEFFAVATEAFFVQPLSLVSEHPELYELLKRFYRQDTAARRRLAKQARG